MHLQVFRAFRRDTETYTANGIPRLGQHCHSAWLCSRDGGYPLKPARVTVWRTAAAGLPFCRYSCGRQRTGRHPLRGCADGLSGRLRGAGADPVRWWIEDPLPKHSRGAGAISGPGDRRCVAVRTDHGAGRQICPRHRLARSAAGRCGRGLDRRGRRIPAGAQPGTSLASACWRDA